MKGQQLFDTRIAPLLSKRCLGCHNDELNDGNISFLNRETLLKGGSHGPAIVPGDPEQSVLIHAVRQDGELKMPPGGRLSRREIRSLVEWIKLGAPWGTKLHPAR
jgi:Planctomycete cytochrome C